MNIIEIYGTANDFSGSFDDDGNHHGQKLLPCPFCGKDDSLEICNTHTPIFWVECKCGAEKHGKYIDGAGNTTCQELAYANYGKALISAVNEWNTRTPGQSEAPVSMEREQVRREHAEWSEKTFGDVGPIGPLKHLSKEALEAAADPSDPLEWADMQFLLWDAQRRMGISDDFITRAMVEKLAINKTRQWPGPKDGEPRLHIKAQQQEPVAEVVSKYGDPEAFGERELKLLTDIQSMPYGAKFYTAPPAPVVLPSFHEWLTSTGRKPVSWVREVMEESYNACRAAMIQGKAEQPQNEQQNIPDNILGWIKCSERMPDNGQKVIVNVDFDSDVVSPFVGEFIWTGSTFRRGVASTGLESSDGIVVTHWMPLPLAPHKPGDL